jgi:hypothetical protein
MAGMFNETGTEWTTTGMATVAGLVAPVVVGGAASDPFDAVSERWSERMSGRASGWL